MKSMILVLLVGLILTGIAQVRTQDLVSKEEAIRIVKEEILKEDTLRVWLYITVDSIGKGSIIKSADSFPRDFAYTNPYPESWFFFIDDIPEAKFMHPCRYLFFHHLRGKEHREQFYSLIYEMFFPTIKGSMERVIPPPGVKEKLSPTTNIDLVSKEEAIRIVKEEILKEDTLRVWLYITAEPIKKDSIVTPPQGYAYTDPYPESWFFFIDDIPEAKFAHPCRYLFFYHLNGEEQYYSMIYEMFFPTIRDEMEQVIPPPPGKKEFQSFFSPKLQVYPSLLSNKTRVLFELPKKSYISLEIQDVAGRLVKQLIKGNQVSGKHSIYWDGKDEKGRKVSSGIYYFLLHIDDERYIIKKAIEIR